MRKGICKMRTTAVPRAQGYNTRSRSNTMQLWALRRLVEQAVQYMEYNAPVMPIIYDNRSFSVTRHRLQFWKTSAQSNTLNFIFKCC